VATSDPAPAAPATPVVEPGFLTRLGLALAAPRWALAVGADPRHPGRAGTDLLRLFGIVLVAVHTRALIGAAWLSTVVGLGAAGQALLTTASKAFTVPLVFLMVGAVVVWLGGGPRRSVGRAFDLACVALIPVITVDIAATLVLRAIGLPDAARVAVLGVGFTWSGALLALALVQLRRRGVAVIAQPGAAS
jgi:hypothetical protein